jgi:hypothetical protein
VDAVGVVLVPEHHRRRQDGETDRAHETLEACRRVSAPHGRVVLEECHELVVLRQSGEVARIPHLLHPTREPAQQIRHPADVIPMGMRRDEDLHDRAFVEQARPAVFTGHGKLVQEIRQLP